MRRDRIGRAGRLRKGAFSIPVDAPPDSRVRWRFRDPGNWHTRQAFPKGSKGSGRPPRQVLEFRGNNLHFSLPDDALLPLENPWGVTRRGKSEARQCFQKASIGLGIHFGPMTLIPPYPGPGMESNDASWLQIRHGVNTGPSSAASSFARSGLPGNPFDGGGVIPHRHHPLQSPVYGADHCTMKTLLTTTR